MIGLHRHGSGAHGEGSAAPAPGEGGGNHHAVLARGLTRRFGRFTAVDHIDLAVEPGEIFGFLGANGAGKTTAIRMLCGLLAPSEGEAWVDGIPLLTRPEEVKLRIGYMSQKFSLYDDLLVEENLTFYGGVYGLKRQEIAERSGEILQRLGLEDQRRVLTGDLPLGRKQRLALGCAVLHRPPILFLDEPTSGVDPLARRRFWDLIYDLADKGATVFVTTHYMDEAEYCGRVSIMDQGKIVALGPPAELKSAHGAGSIEELFLNLVGS
ncbi:MAG TPA: ABC transporter ATP-binding protein [Bacteroidetes bacterium]|nr:ABC transporter ATP-binding protein [Bacteroidota bacterium]